MHSAPTVCHRGRLTRFPAPCFRSATFGPAHKQMSIIPHLAVLGLAAALCSPTRHHQIDFKMSSPDGVERINQLWLATYINEAGLETVAQAKLVTGEYVPLIAADAARLESMMPAARGLAKANNLKMRLIELTNRIDIEDIVP
jgi:hypothetical protein